MALLSFLQQRFRAFREHERGNVLIMFGFALVPVIGLTGATIDYARATNAQQVLNAAIDSAALMAARDASKLSDAQLRDRIDKWIKSNLHGDAAARFTSANIAIDRTARTISIDSELSIDTSLTRVIGFNSMTIASNAQSTWGTNTIELALALDNTGSMDSAGKMTALKTAAKNLIDIMKDATNEPGQIRISVVPFSTQVRLPTTYKNEDWLRFDVRGKVYSYDSRGRTVSTLTRLANKNEWPGCISDRDKNYDTTDGYISGATTTLYPATFCDQVTGVGKSATPTLATIQPLTDSWNTLKNAIDSMTPVGNTNVTIGAMWGMATLTPVAPFTGGRPFETPRLNKFMILLTDGDNTENRFGDSQSTMDNRTLTACATAKAANIRVYTVRVINGNRTMLRSCASTESMYHEVSNAAQLTPVFQQIAREISQVRLTH
ncbi:hypothetical protein ASE63_14195 [Bosea sp. Root381]|uniref:pilus assembly protein n=1 Tax=Bosea sp. Root381 TaxID=1736524 RepID=UPI0006F7EAB5|nr:pilus assembly protein [Bosea sp. Root381]KRE16868.1 hypothetical protein ASE63_14195 [Bosea sp. Root381]